MNLFDGCTALTDLDISSLRTPKVNNMQFLFEDCKSLTSVDLSHFDTSYVTNCRGMFSGCTGLTEIDLSSFRTGDKNVDVSKMFYGCTGLTTNCVSDQFDFAKAYAPEKGTFAGCTNLVGGNGTAYSVSDVTMFRIDSEETPGYLTLGDGTVQPPEPVFGAKFDEETGTLTIFGDLRPVARSWGSPEYYTDRVEAYQENEAVKKIVAAEGTILPPSLSFLAKMAAETIDLSKADASEVTSLGFFDCKNLKNIVLPESGIPNLESLSSAFSGCESLTDISILNSLDISKIRSMSAMCKGCTALTDISPIYDLDTAHITDMSDMFSGCTGLTASCRHYAAECREYGEHVLRLHTARRSRFLRRKAAEAAENGISFLSLQRRRAHAENRKSLRSFGSGMRIHEESVL